MALLEVGKKAPLFTLADQDGKKIKLSDYLGQWVVVYFYPKANTPGCTVQACGISSIESQLKKEKIAVLALSPDPVNKLKNFETKKELKLELLSDEEHKIAEKYGVWDLKKFMGREFMGILRTSFIVDPKGKIAHVMAKVNTKTHHEDVLALIKELKDPSSASKTAASSKPAKKTSATKKAKAKSKTGAIKFYGYKKCGTARKAEKWLKEHDLDFDYIDVTQKPPSQKELKEIISLSGKVIDKFYNTSGGRYKELNMKEKKKDLSAAQQIKLLAGDGYLIKRPLVYDGSKASVGFNEVEFA
ncbi:MAG: thioredoxin-dependent thiol peroxidase, partial [Planctomycetes bacterium]|nr:thioredoxin-dependent thiol peroxidase [Planctomycetota bacterium]